FHPPWQVICGGGPCSRPRKSYLLRGEGVAVSRIAALEAALEPGSPLRRGPVREALRNHISLCRLLKPIVSDGARGCEGLGRVFRVEEAARAVPPDSGEAVCLELLSNRERVGFGLSHRLRPRADVVRRAQQRLHVVPYLVGNDVV